MARRFKLDIAESADYLHKSMRYAVTAARYERLQALWWVKTGRVREHQELARRLGRAPSTITRWLKRYREGGLSGLLERKTAPGRQPALSEGDLKALKGKLDSPEGFPSYEAIRQWLADERGAKLKWQTVYQIVHYRLQASPKVPRPQSTKQDPVALERFKET